MIKAKNKCVKHVLTQWLAEAKTAVMLLIYTHAHPNYAKTPGCDHHTAHSTSHCIIAYVECVWLMAGLSWAAHLWCIG